MSAAFVFAFAVIPSYALENIITPHTTVIRVPSALYLCIEIFSLILILLYCFSKQKKDRWLLILFISVFIVNSGYYCVAISSSLFEALFSDIIVRLGSALLPFSMFITIADSCRFKVKRAHKFLLLFISLFMFFITSSGFYSKLYYKDVSVVIENGTARLIASYGPLYALYWIYLISSFGAMLGVIFYSVKKRKICTRKQFILAVLVILNIVVLLIDSFGPFRFNFLSISYTASCFVLYLIFGIFKDREVLLSGNQVDTASDVLNEEAVQTENHEAE